MRSMSLLRLIQATFVISVLGLTAHADDLAVTDRKLLTHDNLVGE